MSMLIDQIQEKSKSDHKNASKYLIQKIQPKQQINIPYDSIFVQGRVKPQFQIQKVQFRKNIDRDCSQEQKIRKANSQNVLGQDLFSCLYNGKILFKVASPKKQVKQVYQVYFSPSLEKQNKSLMMKIYFERNQQLLRVSSAALRVNLLCNFNYISWMKRSGRYEPTMTIDMKNGLLQLKMPFFFTKECELQGQIPTKARSAGLFKIYRQLINKGVIMVKSFNKNNLQKICQLGNIQDQNQYRLNQKKRRKYYGKINPGSGYSSEIYVNNSDFKFQTISKYLKMSTLNVAISRSMQTAFDLQFKLEDVFTSNYSQKSFIKSESLKLFYFDVQSECQKYRKIKYQITPEDQQVFNRIITVPIPRQSKIPGQNKFLFNQIQPKSKKIGKDQLRIFHEGGFSRISICQMVFKYVENENSGPKVRQGKEEFNQQSMEIIQNLKNQKNSKLELSLNSTKPMDFKHFDKKYENTKRSKYLKKHQNPKLAQLQQKQYVNSFPQSIKPERIDRDKQILIKKWVAVKQPKNQYHRDKIKHQLQILTRLKCASSAYIMKYYVSNDPQFSLRKDLLMDATSQPSLAEHLVLSRNTISFQTKLVYLTQISHSLRFLKNYKIVHMDLNPKNILVMRKQNLVKLIDFGQAYNEDVCKMDQGVSYKPGYTLPYSPPEIIQFYRNSRQKGNHINGYSFTYKQDAFSLGIIIFQVIFSRSPFEGMSYISLKQAYSFKRYLEKLYFSPQVVCQFGNVQIINCLISLIMKCIDPCASRRVQPTWAAVALHEILMRFLQLF